MDGPDRAPVAVIDEFLAWLTQIERSPNTVEAYARDLKAIWSFLASRGVSWDAVRARVSRQFLYSHPGLRAEIERQRGHQRAPARLPVGERARDESIRVRLRTVLDDNKRLREEIAALRDELALAHGRVRELELARRAPARAEPAPGPQDTPCGPLAAFMEAGSAMRSRTPARSSRRSFQAKATALLSVARPTP